MDIKTHLIISVFRQYTEEQFRDIEKSDITYIFSLKAIEKGTDWKYMVGCMFLQGIGCVTELQTSYCLFPKKELE